MAELEDQLASELNIDSEEELEENELGEKDLEEKDIDSFVREMQITKLSQLLSELLETERKYVRDLEQVCEDYLTLSKEHCTCNSLDRKTLKKVRRRGLHVQSLPDSADKNYSAEMFESMASGLDMVGPSRIEIRQMLGNIEDIKDYHKRVMLPRMEEAVKDVKLMRSLFQSEHSRLSRKYGRYCINNTRSSIIIDQNIKYFSLYQFNKGLMLRIDGMLIKPIQRLTRYHMFLSSLAKTCKELGFVEASHEYSAALESILSAANHTNTMMWIGKMENCPLDLSGQGQLLKHGKVLTKCLAGSLKKGRRWSTRSQKPSPCHLFLFQQTVVLCRTSENCVQQHSPHLCYLDHISINQVRIRDTIADNLNTFEVHKLENIKVGISVMGQQTPSVHKKDTKSGVIMRLECESENVKDDWVRAINSEVKQLRNMARSLSSQFTLLS